MNKQEIQAKLHNYEERLKDVAGEIERLREQLAEAEKPKLRHGDWWFTQGCHPCVRVFMKELKARDCVALTDCLITNLGSEYKGEPILGNIFDLLKEWSENLEYFEFDVHHCEINTIEFPHAPIHIAGNWHTLAEAEEIWHKLGQMIATLKRKQT